MNSHFWCDGTVFCPPTITRLRHLMYTLSRNLDGVFFGGDEAVEKLEAPLCSAAQPLLKTSVYQQAKGQPATTNGRCGIASVRLDTQLVR